VFSGKSILGIITARGGSKRIPGKNIKAAVGKPLIAWSIAEALKSRYIDRLIVSTDSYEIKDTAMMWGAEVPFMRPAVLATDQTSSEEVVIHTLKWIKLYEKREYDYFVLLQPTSPLRTEKHIDESIEKFLNDSNALSLVSVSEVDKSPYRMKIINDEGYLEDFIGTGFSAERRLDRAKAYHLNGAIYMSSTELFLKEESFYGGKTSYYIMDSKCSVDIDTEVDFTLAEILLSKSNSDE